MKLIRKKASIKLPIPRKGTKYVARSSSHINDSVPVVLALRDMLHLARNAKEVKQTVQAGNVKINGRVVTDMRRSVRLFNILEAGATYELSLLPTGKFTFVEVKAKTQRLTKVIGKRLINNGAVQITLHDGTTLITKDDIRIDDSLYLDFAGAVKKHVSLQKGSEVFAISGSKVGQKGKVESIDGKKAVVNFGEISSSIETKRIVAL